MKSKLPWLVLTLSGLALALFFFFNPVQQAGDIVEYYGSSQSLLSHGGVALTANDQQQLEQVLHPAYFRDPGYYLTGRAGQRYPVHFVFYSLLLLPARLLLRLVAENELRALALTNVLLAVLALAFVFKKFLKPTFSRFFLLTLFFLSPLAFFFSWPGPDLLYVSLLLIALYYFGQKNYLLASISTAVASWHSQPLLIMSLAFLLFFAWQEIKLEKSNKKTQLVLPAQIITGAMGVGVLTFIPYLYNLWAFGVLTPWTILQNGWTQISGFGLQNLSWQRLFEQFFDLNMGLFVYAPLLFIAAAAAFLVAATKDKRQCWLFLAMLLTAFFYQTNPAWHFGTAGYGPGRHVIFVLPFLFYWLVKVLKGNFFGYAILTLLAASQILVLPLNGGFLPNFEHSLYHNPVAAYVLERWPAFYQPTPEIFVDRTNHSDLSLPTSAVYRNQAGDCLKAYVLISQTAEVEASCGELPAAAKTQLDNEFLRKANYARQVITSEATFWPDTASCEPWYVQDEQHPYQCIKTLQDAAALTGITDLRRLHAVDDYSGVWRLEPGLPITITVPPGYIIHHYALSGAYVNFK